MPGVTGVHRDDGGGIPAALVTLIEFGAVIDQILHCFVGAFVAGAMERGYAVVADRKSKQATVIELWFSGYEDNREVQRQIYFGYVDAGGEAPKARHELTNRLEGRGYHWRAHREYGAHRGE